MTSCKGDEEMRVEGKIERNVIAFGLILALANELLYESRSLVCSTNTMAPRKRLLDRLFHDHCCHVRLMLVN